MIVSGGGGFWIGADHIHQIEDNYDSKHRGIVFVSFQGSVVTKYAKAQFGFAAITLPLSGPGQLQFFDEVCFLLLTPGWRGRLHISSRDSIVSKLRF